MKKMILSLCLAGIMASETISSASSYPTLERWNEEDYEITPKFWYTHVQTDKGMLNLSYKIIGECSVGSLVYSQVAVGYETAGNLADDHQLCFLSVYPTDRKEYADTLLFRQEGDRVYYLPSPDKEERLVLDYSLKQGDEFTDAAGERFFVAEAKRLERGLFNIQTEDGKEPRMLRLISASTDVEDIWVEGIGSLNWGIIPIGVSSSISPFMEMGADIRSSHVAIAYGSSIMGTFDILQADYKFLPFEEDEMEVVYEEEPSLNFSFAGDTLCVQGCKELNCYLSYVECLIEGQTVCLQIKQAFSDDIFDCLSNRQLDIRIPGFKAGTYIINGQTLECKGTTGVEAIQDSEFEIHNDAPAYDLSGRRISVSSVSSASSVLPKGVYVRNGRKIVY
ncbi:MAG: hypothetical protein ILA39_03520 [Bacteroidaceae bacterium]|nr:hypothetical protein [Bacteroidaceae bacterium]